MMSLKQAKRHAVSMMKIHQVPWLVFKTPDSALCNQPGYNLHNKGRYCACRASERSDYEDGGAEFVSPG